MDVKYIYMLKNNITDGKYIGQTNNPKRRLREHKSAHKKKSSSHQKLHQAMKEYGFENFQMTILEEVPTNQAYEKERYYIKKYNTTSLENYNELRGMNILENTPHQEIIHEFINGMSLSKIGKKYNVKHPQIANILKEELGEDKYYEISHKNTFPKKDIPIETIIDLIDNQEYTKKEASEILGVCDSTIVRKYNRWEKQHDSNFQVNPKRLGAKQIDTDLIIKTYAQLKSTRKTANRTGYARSTVRKYLKKEGIL